MRSDWFRRMQIFTAVYGSGPRTSERWIRDGMTSIDDVIKTQHVWRKEDPQVAMGQWTCDVICILPHYRSQGKVMFSEASVCSQGETVGMMSLPVLSHVPSGRGVPEEGGFCLQGESASKGEWVLTSNGSQCSGGFTLSVSIRIFRSRTYFNRFLRQYSHQTTNEPKVRLCECIVRAYSQETVVFATVSASPDCL